MLITIPDVLSKSEVKHCRKLLEESSWHDGKKTAGYIAVDVKTNLQLSIEDPTSKQLGEFIVKVLSSNHAFIAAALPAKILPPRFNRYEGGGAYGNHIDNAIFVVPDTGEKIRTDVSTTLFFSDPDEYEGGELIIEDTYGTQSVKLPAGHMVIYPGTSLHRVNPVTKGTRYASFFWSQSMVRHAHKRSILWNLDQSIQSIAVQEPNSPTLSNLSGVYHNLIREWAEL